MRKIYTIILLFILIIVVSSSSLLAIGVKPLSLNLIGKPGDTLNYKVTINPSDKPGLVKLSLCRVTQLLDGTRNYQPVDPSNYSVAGWFSFPNLLKVFPGTPGEITGKVKLPLDAKGDYNMMLMVVPESERVMIQGINVMVRYGVELNVKADRPGLRATADVTSFDIIKDNNGMPEIQAKVKNTSALNYITFAYATIRNNQRKLIQKIDLLPGSYWEKNNYGDPILYPEGELLYTGKVTEFLSPGQYELRLFYRFANNGQVLQSKMIDIKEGDYKFPAESVKKLKISPASIALEGRPGTMSMKAVKIENRLNQPVIVVVEGLEIEPNYPYSIFSNTVIDLKGGKQFTVGANQMAVRIISVKLPKEAPVQGNYGNLRIKVYSNEEKPILLDEVMVDLSATVIGDKKRAVEFTDLTGESNKDEYVVAAVFKNIGDVVVSPRISLILRDNEGKLVTKIFLGEGEEDISVLPNRMTTVNGNLNNIKPGDYVAELQATEGNIDLGSSKFNLKVK